MSINWSTASGDEIFERMKMVHENLRSVQRTKYVPYFIFYNPFEPMITRVKKGPAKGRRKMLMVK